MNPEDQPETAFVTPQGLFEFTVLAFGLKNAAATFQKLVDKILRVTDDIGIFSQTWNDHMMHLEEVLQRIKKAGLTVKATKCHVGKNELKYLGYIAGNGKIKLLESKVESIVNWPMPTSKKKMQSFLVLAGYYRWDIVALWVKPQKPCAARSVDQQS